MITRFVGSELWRFMPLAQGLLSSVRTGDGTMIEVEYLLAQIGEGKPENNHRIRREPAKNG